MITPDQQKEMYEDVKEMKKALIGTSYGQKGLVSRVEDNEKYISKDKKVKWVGIGIAGLMGMMLKYWDKLSNLLN